MPALGRKMGGFATRRFGADAPHQCAFPGTADLVGSWSEIVRESSRRTVAAANAPIASAR